MVKSDKEVKKLSNFLPDSTLFRFQKCAKILHQLACIYVYAFIPALIRAYAGTLLIRVRCEQSELELHCIAFN